MTGPVTRDDVVSGLLTYLLAQPDVVSVVGTDPDGKPMLYGYSNWSTLELTQSTCVFIGNEGGWAGPNIHNTMRFPRISLNVWVDPMRDAQNNVANPGEAMTRANNAYEVIDRHLHRPQGESQMWGTVRSISSVRLTEPGLIRLSDGDTLVRLQATYAVTQG